MFTDPVVPVWMRNPPYVELILKTEGHLQIRTPLEFIEDDPVVNPFDPDLPALLFVEQLPPFFSYLGKADGTNPEERFRALGRPDALFA